MIARAPGKIVLSGAYAVLEGAPAVVTAVDRYVTADTERPPSFVTEEVRAAIGDETPPWFDASALRSGDHKLGLGSSAAILVASLGARAAREQATTDEATLRRLVLEPALVAHRKAQGGGSGIDVAASVHGGTLVAIRRGDELSTRPVALPSGLVIEVLFAGVPASTPALVARVREHRARAPEDHAALMARLGGAAGRAVSALDAGDVGGFVAALREQLRGFLDLGRRAGAIIVTPEVEHLAGLAEGEDATVIPAGAGGGDVAIYAGPRAPSSALGHAFRREHVPLGLRLGARGLHVPDLSESAPGAVG